MIETYEKNYSDGTSISHFIWTMVKIKLGYIYFLKKKK